MIPALVYIYIAWGLSVISLPYWARKSWGWRVYYTWLTIGVLIFIWCLLIAIFSD